MVVVVTPAADVKKPGDAARLNDRQAEGVSRRKET
tara:strand:- start:214 stop:318 length:105 start_codon:yes stop_codon:yes gene_type:complete